MRTVVLLIPYSIKSGKLFVMMQQRSMQQKRIPGYISFFGGGMNEGESEEQALTREVKEELNFEKKDIPYFFVIDKTGKITYATSGEYNDKKLDAITDALSEE